MKKVHLLAVGSISAGILSSWGFIELNELPEAVAQEQINVSKCLESKAKASDGAIARTVNLRLNESTIRGINSRVSRAKIEKLNPETISITGMLNSSQYGEIEDILSPDIRVLNINSSGGDALVAMQLGLLVRERNWEVRVAGVCASACANYIAPAATTLTAEGVIGFHGGVQACLDLASKWQLIRNFGIRGLLKLEWVARQERLYSEKVRLPLKLIYSTQAPDRGFNDGIERVFYSPSIQILKENGFPRITGKIDAVLIDGVNHVSSLNGAIVFESGTHPGFN